MSDLLQTLRNKGFVKTLTFTDRRTGARESRDLILYEGLLFAARRNGLKSMKSTMLQAPSERNEFTVIVQVSIETASGVFEGIGDANPSNVNARIRPHFIRMAETRARSRALKASLELHGMVSAEEIEQDFDHDSEDFKTPHRFEADRDSTPRTTISGRNGGESRTSSRTKAGTDVHERPISDRQRKYVFDLLRARGLEGRAANDELRLSYGVDDLACIPASRASHLINSLRNGSRTRTAV